MFDEGHDSATVIVEDVKEWRGQDVLDPGGDKLGKLEEVYYDTESDRPAFAAIKSGMIGRRLTLVPIIDASVGRSFLRVKVDKEAFKKAPSFEPSTELTPENEARIYGHFRLEYRPAGQGARRLAKH
jgi:hypothetical protein